MRLESVFGPDALHARMADAHLFGHGAHAPVRGVDGTLFHGLLDDLEFDRCADWFPAGRFGATFHEAFDTGFGEILLPAPNRGLGDANLSHDRHDAMTIRRHEDDPCAFDDLLWSVSIGNQLLQLQSSLPLEHKSRSSCSIREMNHDHTRDSNVRDRTLARLSAWRTALRRDWSAISSISALSGRVSGAGLCWRFSNFRFGGAETVKLREILSELFQWSETFLDYVSMFARGW